MADREKVEKALDCRADGFGLDCKDCAYYREDTPAYCNFRQILRDAISLLKERETEWEKIWEAPDGTYKGRCKRCGFVHIFIENHDSQYNFCPSCGRDVKRE